MEHAPAAPRAGSIYYGWVLVVTLALTETVSWGVLYYAFGVFIAPMQDELGWSIAQLTGAYSLALLLSGLAALPIGRWLDRYGPRLLMTAGSIGATLLVIAWSRVDSLAGFYLIWAGIGLVMAAVLYEPALWVVATWFRRQRSRALTLLTFVAGFASVIFIPLAEALVSRYGWRDALLVLSLILATATILPHAVLLRRRPQDLGLAADGDRPAALRATPVERSVASREALQSGLFWWLAGAFVLAMFANVAVTVHLIPFLIGEGYGSGFAAAAAGGIGLLALPGRLIFTPLGSRLPRRVVTAAIFALQAAALAVLLLAPGSAGLIAFVVLFGTGFGAITPARAALVVELFGPASYGSISGVLALCVTTARGAGPVAAGLLVGLLGSYVPVFWGAAAVSLLAAVAALQARTPASAVDAARQQVLE